MDRYERLEQIDYKSARDVVTEADHLSEALILDAIRARYPGDAILAEETGEHRAIAGEAPTSGRGRVWIVDPLDGTVNYANGIPFFCVSIGAGRRRPPGRRGHPRPDARRDVRRDRRRPGDARTAGRSTRPTRTSCPTSSISMALNGRTAATRARNVRKAIRISRSMGSAALALAYVANGRFDAFVQQGGLSAWDVAAAGLIAERGGATRHLDRRRPVVRPRARRPRSIGILAAPPAHHDGAARRSSGSVRSGDFRRAVDGWPAHTRECGRCSAAPRSGPTLQRRGCAPGGGCAIGRLTSLPVAISSTDQDDHTDKVTNRSGGSIARYEREWSVSGLIVGDRPEPDVLAVRLELARVDLPDARARRMPVAGRAPTSRVLEPERQVQWVDRRARAPSSRSRYSGWNTGWIEAVADRRRHRGSAIPTRTRPSRLAHLVRDHADRRTRRPDPGRRTGPGSARRAGCHRTLCAPAGTGTA